MSPLDLTIYANAAQWLNLSAVPISGISNTNPGVVTTPAANAFLSTMPVTLTSVGGMTEVNGQTYPVTVIDPTHFSIGVDTTSFGVYTVGGFASIDHSLLERLISACSSFMQRWMSRIIANQQYNETRNGLGQPTMPSKLTPVNQTYAGVPFPYGPSGYTFDEAQVYLSGFQFCRGYQNVQWTYNAGYMIPNEPQVVPASLTLTTIARWSAGDLGVTYANGTPLVRVASAPLQGQYTALGSTYGFNVADVGQLVLISYAMIPYDIEQACIDLIGDWFKARARIGVTSESIEQQSITFNVKALTDRARGVMEQYARRAPIW